MTSIVARYATTPTSNVDVVRDMCLVKRAEPDGGAPAEYDPEYFADHVADITIKNVPPSELSAMPDRGPSITIDEYLIDFKINECRGTCPDLTPLRFSGPSFTVPANNEHAATLPMVPMRTKIEFIEEGGTPESFSSYSARYSITGHDGHGTFVLAADAEFSLGNFDNCEIKSGS